MTVDSNHEGCPNFYPNSFSGPKDDIRKYSESKYTLNHADVARFNSSDEDNFTQCGIFFNKTLNQEERVRLVDNIASHIINAQEFLQVKSFSCNLTDFLFFLLFKREQPGTEKNSI